MPQHNLITWLAKLCLAVFLLKARNYFFLNIHYNYYLFNDFINGHSLLLYRQYQKQSQST